MSSSTRSTRGKLAVTVRDHGPDSPEAAHARRAHRVMGLEEHIAEVVASAPPLTSEQIERLRSLLSGAEVDQA